MAHRQTVALISLLALTAAHPSQQTSVASQQTSAVSQQPSAVSQQPSAADQLSALLGPVVQGAVSRAQSDWQLAQLTGRLQRLQDGADDGRRALTELTRQQVRLDTIVHDMAALQMTVLAGGGWSIPTAPGDDCRPSKSVQHPVTDTNLNSVSAPKQELRPVLKPKSTPRQKYVAAHEPVSRPEPNQVQEQRPRLNVEQEPTMEHEPACEALPMPLPADVATYQEPATRACARSCLQLRSQNGSSQDGVYWLTGLPVPVFCDFSHDDGGWTLLLTAVSRQGWDPLSVLGRSMLSPSLTDDYSILQHANTIRDLGSSDRFAYRIETQAEKGRQRWGGIWFAPRRYSFTDETATQTEVSLVRRFDNWNYKNDGIKKRMPWINTGGYHKMLPILTTAGPTDANWWGTIVTHLSHPTHNHSPWLNPEGFHSGNVLYWVREDAV